jgi:glutathione reductase (NADPH)
MAGGRSSTRHTLISVGGQPNLPNIPGRELCITSDGFFDIETQPSRVVTVGAGYIGVELSAIFHALGTDSHLFIRGVKVLRSFDPMVQDVITSEYERQGINIHKISTITRIEDLGNGKKRVFYDEGDQKDLFVDEVDHVLFAIGRSPMIDGLGLDNLGGVTLNKEKHIVVDRYQRTSVDNIYALGDVCDKGFELTPVAIAAGRRLSDRLFGGKLDSHLEYENIPSVVFAHPEVGTIGLTEPQARDQYGDAVKIYKAEFTAMYYAMTETEHKKPMAFKLVVVGQ